MRSFKGWLWLALGCAGAAHAAVKTEQVIAPSAFDWRIGGTVQGDGLLLSTAEGEVEKRTELRRTRIGTRIVLARPLRFSASVDVSQGARLGDLYLDWRPSKLWWMAGRFPEPFGLAAQEGSRTTPLMERPQASALGPGYNTGIALSWAGARWAASAGAFKGAGPSSDVLKGARKEDALTLRLTAVPLRRPDTLLHLGLGASLRKPQQEALRFIAIPESVLIRDYQVASGFLPTEEGYTLLGTELALRQGPVLVQGEYLRAAIRLDASLPESVYSGWYGEAAWALTGERRGYSTRAGVFGPVDPSRSWRQGGAWELAARYGEVRFEKNPLEDIPGFDEFDDFGLFTGGKGQIASLGLNWYPTRLTRVALNGLRIEKSREDQQMKANVVQMRLYWQFDLKRGARE